jgi:hypothetical protein
VVPLHIHSVLEEKSVNKLDLSGIMWRREGGREGGREESSKHKEETLFFIDVYQRGGEEDGYSHQREEMTTVTEHTAAGGGEITDQLN